MAEPPTVGGVEGTERVAGESRAVLREALAHTRTRRRDDGTLELDGAVPPELAETLARALGRVADELHEADVARGGAVREGGELHAAALMALLLRVTDR